jgi:hypothetical protein
VRAPPWSSSAVDGDLAAPAPGQQRGEIDDLVIGDPGQDVGASQACGSTLLSTRNSPPLRSTTSITGSWPASMFTTPAEMISLAATATGKNRLPWSVLVRRRPRYLGGTERCGERHRRRQSKARRNGASHYPGPAARSDETAKRRGLVRNSRPVCWLGSTILSDQQGTHRQPNTAPHLQT